MKVKNTVVVTVTQYSKIHVIKIKNKYIFTIFYWYLFVIDLVATQSWTYATYKFRACLEIPFGEKCCLS
jgi:hypothetical protein